jgi:hypothetical protein
LKNEAFEIGILSSFHHVYKEITGLICQSGWVFCNLAVPEPVNKNPAPSRHFFFSHVFC